MDGLGKSLSALSFAIIGIIVLIGEPHFPPSFFNGHYIALLILNRIAGLFQKKTLLSMFTIGVSLAVAAIPGTIFLAALRSTPLPAYPTWQRGCLL